jgi:hypothetical protein
LGAGFVDYVLVKVGHAVEDVCEDGHEVSEFLLGEGGGGEARVFVLCEETRAEGWWVEEAEFCEAGEVVAQTHCSWALEESDDLRVG